MGRQGRTEALLKWLIVARSITAAAVASGLVLPFTHDDLFGFWYAHRTSNTEPGWFNASFFVAPLLLVLVEWRIRSWWVRLIGSVLQLASLLGAGALTLITLMGSGPRLIGADVAFVAIPLHGLLTVVFAAWCCVALYRGEPAA